jgi:hypothetical protein
MKDFEDTVIFVRITNNLYWQNAELLTLSLVMYVVNTTLSMVIFFNACRLRISQIFYYFTIQDEELHISDNKNANFRPVGNTPQTILTPETYLKPRT